MAENILTENPFKNPPKVEAGDFNIRDIYWRMGYVIHLFNVCESKFAYVYNNLANPSLDGDILIRSFGSIISSTTKRSVLDEAGNSYFRKHDALEDAIAKQFSWLLGVYKDAASRRNEIAHGAVYGSYNFFFADNGKPKVEWFFSPQPTASNKRPPLSSGPKGDMKYRYNSTELEKLADNLEKFDNTIAKFIADLCEFREKLPPENT